jgi:hypothetical protein
MAWSGFGAAGAGAGAGPNNDMGGIVGAFGGLELTKPSANASMGVVKPAYAAAAGPANAAQAYKVGTDVLVTMSTESEPPSEEIIKLYNPVYVEDRYLLRNDYMPVTFMGGMTASSYLNRMGKQLYRWAYNPKKGYLTFHRTITNPFTRETTLIDENQYYMHLRALSRNATFCMKGINPAYADTSLQNADLIIFSAYPLVDESSGERRISILSYATIKYHRGSHLLEVDVLCSKQNEYGVSNTAAFLLMKAQELAIAIGGKTHLYLSAVPDKVSYYESLGFVKDPSHKNNLGVALVPMTRGLDYVPPRKGGKRKHKRNKTRNHKKSKSQKKRR